METKARIGKLLNSFHDHEDFTEGEVTRHGIGHTVCESEHMQLTVLTRNSHPLHFDEVYCRERSFMKTRVVEGGLVFAWIASLASRDTTANALWELGYDKAAIQIRCLLVTRCTPLRALSKRKNATSKRGSSNSNSSALRAKGPGR